MKTQKNELATLSEQQGSPNLCDPRDFEVIEADESADPKMAAPFHGQCGSTGAEYESLLREGDRAANASNFSAQGEVHPDVNRAGKPRTPGIDGAEGA